MIQTADARWLTVTNDSLAVFQSIIWITALRQTRSIEDSRCNDFAFLPVYV